MNKLSIKKTINLNYNEDDWDLYCHIEGADIVASTLSEMFCMCVNDGAERAEVERQMHKTMNKYREWGAYDSEPIRVLDTLLDKVYG